MATHYQQLMSLLDQDDWSEQIGKILDLIDLPLKAEEKQEYIAAAPSYASSNTSLAKLKYYLCQLEVVNQPQAIINLTRPILLGEEDEAVVGLIIYAGAEKMAAQPWWVKALWYLEAYELGVTRALQKSAISCLQNEEQIPAFLSFLSEKRSGISVLSEKQSNIASYLPFLVEQIFHLYPKAQFIDYYEFVAPIVHHFTTKSSPADRLAVETSAIKSWLQHRSSIREMELPVVLCSEFENEKLGEGSYGVVYKGFARRKAVAVKNARDYRERLTLLEEAFNLKQLKDVEHTVQIKGISFGGETFLKMHLLLEFIPGRTLRRFFDEDILARDYPIAGYDTPASSMQKKELASKIALGLKFIHNEGLIHRDLNSGNIMLDHDLHPKIIDFGSAKLANSAPDVLGQYSLTAMWVVPPEACANEMVRDLSAQQLLAHQDRCNELFGLKAEHLSTLVQFTKASDVYSLGVLLCMLARKDHRPPEDYVDACKAQPLGEEGSATQRKFNYLYANRNIDFLDLPAELSEPYNNLVRTMMANPPAKRPPIDRVVAELDRICRP
jgi:hypothetical protein